MKLLPFKESRDFSLGVELEYQIINPNTANLGTGAKDLIRNVSETEFEAIIKPEITQSMLEINTSIHDNPKSVLAELTCILSQRMEGIWSLIDNSIADLRCQAFESSQYPVLRSQLFEK